MQASLFFSRLVVISSLCLSAWNALAQTPTLPPPVPTPAAAPTLRDPAQTDAPPVMGWSKTAILGVNLALSSSESVVGQTDGSSHTYGTNLKGTLNHLSERDEWRNALTLLGATTRTPSIPRYIKSNDEAKLESIYLFPIPSFPTLAPYVRGEASAPIFKGEDVRATSSVYRLTNRPAGAQLVTGTSLRLTDGFRPLTTKEGVGVLWKAVNDPRLKIEARSGFGALQVAANRQLSVQETNAAGEIVVVELTDVNQAGLELGLSAKGKIQEQSSYEIGVETLTPFINNKQTFDDRDAIGLTNVDGYAKLSSKINDWASLGYDYKLKIQPQLQVPAQQIHMMVLNINQTLL